MSCVVLLCSSCLRLVRSRVTSFCLSSRPGACLIFFREDIRLKALLSCAEIVNSTTLDSSLCVLTVHNPVCLKRLRCAPYAYGRILLQLLIVCLQSSCDKHRGCVLLVVEWRRRVKCACYFYPRAHTLNTKKKKIAPVIRVVVVTRRLIEITCLNISYA
jgi:hypothetical protein